MLRDARERRRQDQHPAREHTLACSVAPPHQTAVSAANSTSHGITTAVAAAGTIGFVDRTRGYRVGGYAQYMPAEALPFQRDFGKAFYKDVMA